MERRENVVSERSSKGKWVKRVCTVIAVLGCYLMIETCAGFMNVILPWHRSSAIEIALTWGGLADLPETAEDVKVTTSGGAFTRTFEVRFHAPKPDVRQWIADSHRLSGAKPVEDEDGRVLYEVYPGEEEAIGGTVEVREGTSVRIYMSWS